MDYLNDENKDFKEFSIQYKDKQREILILTTTKSGAASKFYDSWVVNQYFLAYVDLDSNNLKKGEGRIVWLISEEDRKSKGITYPYYFKQETVYRLKVRDLIDNTVPEGYSASAYNRFMLVEIVEENAQSEVLSQLLEEYRKPILINDDQLGRFELNKELHFF